ncbi:MAG: hypothetical protein ABL898_17090 [Hyphomicrobiaceae bacterium]|nr:hypothetical protein [Hyphomicrobiaceae bacterium]
MANDSDDPYFDRKQLTFEQAEGIEPLPTQLALHEVSPHLRAALWEVVRDSLLNSTITGINMRVVSKPWLEVLRVMHVERHHRLTEFSELHSFHQKELRRIFEVGNSHAIYGLLQWLLRFPPPPISARIINNTLLRCRSSYRVLGDGRTIIPLASLEEVATLDRAFADLAATEFHGARAHLRKAAECLTEGATADSIRESIHAVESVARILGGKTSLAGALQTLKSKHGLHPGLEQGFKSIYGFTSDEKGIRHPLLDDGTAKVDEADAMLMIGACASFVSYLINKTKP